MRAEGPLRPAAAVDALLQLIAGLEAAYAGAFCIATSIRQTASSIRNGTVKIGDFGLSIFTTAGLQPAYTATLRMTPQFAALKRLEGAVPDVRAQMIIAASSNGCSAPTPR